MDYLVVGADGKEYGPVDIATLAEWAKADRVRPESVVKEFASGRAMPASQVPGLFMPLAGPVQPSQNWSQPPDYYHRTAASQPVRVYRIDPGRYIVWAILDACLAILFVLTLRTVGPILFCVLSFYNSIRSIFLQHKLCWIAFAASVAAVVVVMVVLFTRAAHVV